MVDEYIKNKERKIEHLRLENEEADQRVSLAQKKAIIREAKRRYGPDWRKVLGLVKSIKPDIETVHELYGLGIGDLRELTKPPKRPWR